MNAFHGLSACLAGTAILFFSGCNVQNESLEKMERENAKLRNDVLGLTDQLRQANTNFEVEKISRARVESELSATLGKLRTVEKELESARQEFQTYRRDFHLQSRVRAVGERFAELATTDGKTYRDAVIRAVLADSVVFSHADGQARLPIASLGADWLKRFDLDAATPVCLIDEATLKQACATAAKSR